MVVWPLVLLLGCFWWWLSLRWYSGLAWLPGRRRQESAVVATASSRKMLMSMSNLKNVATR